MKRIDKDCINVLGKNLNNYEAEKLANDILDELHCQATIDAEMGADVYKAEKSL